MLKKTIIVTRGGWHLAKISLPQHSVEKWKIYSHRKKDFREINYLIISLVKPVLSRNFCQNSEWHSVENEKIFRQINSLVISLAKTLLSRNFCQKSVRYIHTVWKLRIHSVVKWKIYSHQKNISSNYWVISLVKPLVSRHFCRKSVKVW